MALSGTQKKLLLLVLAFACLSSSGAEAWSWSWSSGSGRGWGSDGSSNSSSGPREIVVGGSDGWKLGVNYEEWASKNAPFYIDDVLVFKYDKHIKRRNNVYLLHEDGLSYVFCDLRDAKMIGPTNTRSEESFKFTLKKKHPYFFASGEHDGPGRWNSTYCWKHKMRFCVIPVGHRSD